MGAVQNLQKDRPAAAFAVPGRRCPCPAAARLPSPSIPFCLEKKRSLRPMRLEAPQFPQRGDREDPRKSWKPPHDPTYHTKLV